MYNFFSGSPRNAQDRCLRDDRTGRISPLWPNGGHIGAVAAMPYTGVITNIFTGSSVEFRARNKKTQKNKKGIDDLSMSQYIMFFDMN